MTVNLSGPHLMGVDVSHHQAPTSLNWATMKSAGCSFAIVRATYGTMVDKAATEHIKRARDAGLSVGVYHFYRASQHVEAQFESFKAACNLAGYGKPQDIAPTLDLEDDTSARPLEPAHAEGAETLATLFKLSFGVKPMLYITQRDWGRVGKPDWCLQLPLWVAHYSAASRVQPATPNGAQYAIWQNRVGRFDPKGPHGYYKDEAPLIDHNHARWLPLLDGTKLTPNDALSSLDPMGSERHLDEVDKTGEKRSRALDELLRAEAQHHATESTFSLLEQARIEGMREAAGIVHDTDPSELGPESEKA
jgi:hypothetical protein